MELYLEPFCIVAFIVLLLASVWVTFQFYVCDSHNCKSFNEADNAGPRGSKEYVIALTAALYADGIWPLPYIGATILTLLALWLLWIPITVRNFAIIFIVSFLVIYFLFAFFGHHFIKFTSNYIIDYIENSCPGTDTPTADNGSPDEVGENVTPSAPITPSTPSTPS